jgi:hypothetical protein
MRYTPGVSPKNTTYAWALRFFFAAFCTQRTWALSIPAPAVALRYSEFEASLYASITDQFVVYPRSVGDSK